MKKNLVFQGQKIGFLGGGQLARMMALRAHEIGLTPLIYCASRLEPAAQVTPHVTLGKMTDQSQLLKFLSECDWVTFESEFLNAELIKKCQEQTKTNVFPSADSMSLLQDRLVQKHSLIDFDLPTAPFMGVRSISDLKTAQKFLGKNLVLKKRRNGYDGNGTYFISAKTSPAQLKKIFNEVEHSFIAETKILFKRELAIMAVRDQFNKIQFYPLVESKQKEARCDWVQGPINHKGLKPLKKGISRFLNQINYVGVIGFELFDTGKKLLINETAPRVHNSGHYTQLATWPDQFSAHVMAISGFSVPKITVLSKGFSMVNLIGESTHTMGLPLDADCSIHLYGKNENRKGRKMGHLNVVSTSGKKALKKGIKERNRISK